MATASNAAAAAEKRRLILDAAVRVFARQGFHACRVSDIADEAGVAYWLVYHYFRSKDEVLDTLFLERWNIMLEAIRETDGQDIPARRKLEAIGALHDTNSSRNGLIQPRLERALILERQLERDRSCRMNKPGLNRGSIQHSQNWSDFGEKCIEVGNQQCPSNSTELS